MRRLLWRNIIGNLTCIWERHIWLRASWDLWYLGLRGSILYWVLIILRISSWQTWDRSCCWWWHCTCSCWIIWTAWCHCRTSTQRWLCKRRRSSSCINWSWKWLSGWMAIYLRSTICWHSIDKRLSWYLLWSCMQLRRYMSIRNG